MSCVRVRTYGDHTKKRAHDPRDAPSSNDIGGARPVFQVIWSCPPRKGHACREAQHHLAVACMERHRGGLTTGHPTRVTIRARESSLQAKAPEFMTAPVGT